MGGPQAGRTPGQEQALRIGQAEGVEQAKAQLLDAAGMSRVLEAMADAVLKGGPPEGLALIGIRRRGVPLARRLAERLAAQGVAPPVGELDISLYRDDFLERASQPLAYSTAVPFAVAGRRIVLVDDVFFTGRTARAALQAVVDLGRPARLELAVLVDRDERELPIRPDIVGVRVNVPPTDWVEVRVQELDGYDGVYVFERGPREPPPTPGGTPKR